jgi:hypothetical protein
MAFNKKSATVSLTEELAPTANSFRNDEFVGFSENSRHSAFFKDLKFCQANVNVRISVWWH